MSHDRRAALLSRLSALAVPALILVLAALLRFYRLDFQSLWYDEAYTASVTDPATVSLAYIWSSGPVAVMPPLHHTLVYLSRLIGTGEAWLRLPSVLAGILTVLMVYLTGTYCFNKRVGAFSSLAVAVSVFHIYYSQEARAYALFMLFSIASSYFLLRAARERRVSWWVGYSAACAMGLYTHLFMVFVLVVQNTYLLSQWQGRRVSGRSWFLSQIASVLPFMPWLVTYAGYYVGTYLGTSSNEIWYRALWMPEATPMLPGYVLRDFVCGGPCDFPSAAGALGAAPNAVLQALAVVANRDVALVAFLAAIGVGFWRLRRQNKEKDFAEFFGMCVLLPLLLMLAISFRARILNARYFSFAFPSFYLLFGVGIDQLGSRRTRLLLLGGILAINAVGLANYYANSDFQREPWRDVVGWIEQRALQTDAIFVSGDVVLEPVNYYYKGDLARTGLGVPFEGDREQAWSLIDSVMAGRDRAWLVVWLDWGLSTVYSDALRQHCRIVEQREFRSIRVDLYESCDP